MSAAQTGDGPADEWCRCMSTPVDLDTDGAETERSSKRAKVDHERDAVDRSDTVGPAIELDPELVGVIAVLGDWAILPIMARVSHAWRRGVKEIAPTLARAYGLYPRWNSVHHRRPYVNTPYTYDLELASRGWTVLLERARAQGLEITTCAYEEAARYWQFETLKWLWANIARHIPSSNRIGWFQSIYTPICANAVRAGRLDILQWLRSDVVEQCAQLVGYSPSHEVPDANALCVPVEAYIDDGPLQLWDERTCSLAAHWGHLDVLMWARKHGCPWGWEVCDMAAEGGHLDALKWAHANGAPWSARLWACATRSGSIEILDWIAANNLVDDRHAHDGSDRNGNRITYGRSKGAVHSGGDSNNFGGVCVQAARLGRIDMLEWARAHDCEWGPNVCAKAARHGHIEVLEWLRARGCPWDRGTYYAALRGGHPGLLEWLDANGCPRG